MDERLSALEFRRKPRPSAVAERALVELVRSAEGGGARFRRQHAVGPYLLDLYSPEHRLAVELAVEIDPRGRVAAEAAFHDQVRRRYLAVSGIRVLVFAEAEILHDGARVAGEIARVLAEATTWVPARGRGGPVRR